MGMIVVLIGMALIVLGSVCTYEGIFIIKNGSPVTISSALIPQMANPMQSLGVVERTLEPVNSVVSDSELPPSEINLTSQESVDAVKVEIAQLREYKHFADCRIERDKHRIKEVRSLREQLIDLTFIANQLDEACGFAEKRLGKSKRNGVALRKVVTARTAYAKYKKPAEDDAKNKPRSKKI